MFELFEDQKNEFKIILNDTLEKEVVSFLNSKTGGSIYLGISDSREIVGIKGKIDKVLLEIKDRIKTNISPSTIGLYDIFVEKIEDKDIIHIILASGKEKPYYIKKYGMTPEGCFIRVGSSCESMSRSSINNFFSNRIRNSLKNIISPNQNLSFSQLKIFYSESGYEINDNFLMQLDLFTEDNQYNYIAYLLADNNNVSIKVAKYKNNDSVDLLENEEYGFCCLIKATKNILNKLDLENRTFTKITSIERKELKQVDSIALREVVINAIVHNDWANGTSPKFEIFADHMSISSSGGLHAKITEEEFLRGFSSPKNPELMRVFKDVNLVEHLGTGILRVLKKYDKDIYEIYQNFIRVNFKYVDREKLDDTRSDTKSDIRKLTKIQMEILKLIEIDGRITQNELADKLDVSRITIARNIKILIDNNTIIRKGATKKSYWELINKE